jgi:serine/threonine-protein phosphatase 2A regulatory subunit A
MDCIVDDSGSQERRVSIAERLAQRVMALTEDDSENVRAALAMVATELAPLLGKDLTITHLLPPMLLLLRDSTSEVRLNIISSLSLLNDVIGDELLSQSLFPAILELAEDGKWRIRMAVIERMPLLAKHLGKDFFNDKLLELCVGWLGDDISSIREAAAKNLKELTTLLGSEWSIQHLLPRVKAMMENPSYLRRMNAVQGIVYMATAMDINNAQLEALPILLEMACDTVPNVRFNVAKGLGVVGPLFNRFVYESQIIPILSLLKDDPDRDVRYFANQTSDSLRKVFDNER